MSLEIFDDPVWQMSRGERAAVEGVLSQLKPALAVEIGSMEGGCLLRIAAHAVEAHSFDLQSPSLAMPDNVTLHTGDSHELLPQFLAELSEQQRNVDLAVVDGDHTPEGVRQDIEDLLDSPAVADTVILIHDTANERVRAGIDAVRFAAWPKVAHVELDWIPGQLFAERELRNELWYGLGLVLVDASRLAARGVPIFEQRYHPSARLLAQARDLVVAREQVPPDVRAPELEEPTLRHRVARLEAELGAVRARAAVLEAELARAQRSHEGAERALENIKSSASWKMTEPLRGAKRRVRRTGG